MHDEPEKKKKGLRLVSRKSTRKMLGKWRKLSSDENDMTTTDESERIEEFDVAVRQVLGLRLVDAVMADPSLDGVPLPSFFRHALDFVEQEGLTTEGIYRLSPPKNRLDELERRANCGDSMVFADVHDATGLIKRFLRQIPEPVVPLEFENIAESCQCGLATTSQLKRQLVCNCGAVRKMRYAMNSLENERKTLFVYVFLHAQHVMVQEKENKMGLQALGLLLQTVLEMSRKLVCFCAHAIRPFDQIPVEGACYLVDENVKIRRYVPPLNGEFVEKWLEKEDLKIDGVSEELAKQQFLLDLLHSKISARHEKGVQTGKLDENAWQVQNSITLIKRKLKQLSEMAAPIASVNRVDTRCIEIYEEKQLMATQGMLREDVSVEQNRIAKLCWKLKNIENSASLDEKIIDNNIEEEEEKEWKERCQLEEAARTALLEEIGRLRSACAGLRARLELETSKSQDSSV